MVHWFVWIPNYSRLCFWESVKALFCRWHAAHGSLSVYWSVKAGQWGPAEEERMICPLLSAGFLCALPHLNAKWTAVFSRIGPVNGHSLRYSHCSRAGSTEPWMCLEFLICHLVIMIQCNMHHKKTYWSLNLLSQMQISLYVCVRWDVMWTDELFLKICVFSVALQVSMIIRVLASWYRLYCTNTAKANTVFRI